MDGGQKMTLSDFQIKTKKHKTKKTVISVMEGSGVFMICDPKPSDKKREPKKRFELRMRFPFNKDGKLEYVPLGTWGKEIKTRDDVIEKSLLIKNWSKINNRNPKEFNEKLSNKKEKTLSEVFESFMEFHKKKTKEVTWKVSLNRLNQMLDFYGKDRPLADFEINNGGRQLVIAMMRPIEERGSINHASRCRRLLNNVFEFAESEGWMDFGQNPAFKKPVTEGVGHIKKSNPTLDWKEVPELLSSIEKNECDGSLITQLATKFYLLCGIRVSGLVSLQWKWYDSKQNLWRIPSETRGLKRKKGEGQDHLIPVTPEMKKLMDRLLEINGHQEYVFWSPEGKNYPHLNPETINNHLTKLGYLRRLTAHGWRDVIVTSGQEVGNFQRDIILRQIGHTEHKQGASGCYDNTEFLPQRREFLEWWSKELVRQGMKI